MKTVVVTDGKYRASLAAVRVLGAAGYPVVVTQTREDSPTVPASFRSRYTARSVWIDGSSKDADYPQRLLLLLKTLEHPVLFCTGADTLNQVSRHREDFAPLADFLIAEPEVLDQLNDKACVHRRCLELDIPVPRSYDAQPETYPVVIKPHCGEKFGLKARDRYVIAQNPTEFQEKYQAMARYGPPIVQEKLEGDGEGADLLLGPEGELLCALCHRRLREYPVTGGPSTCCVSFYDEAMIRQSHALLKSFGFVGMAMVEWKGRRVLEVNPRVWGSFPLTACCGSPYTLRYAQAAAGEAVSYTPQDFQSGVKMRFLFNDGAATLGYLRRGDWKRAMGGVTDFFRVREAFDQKDDRGAYRAYLKNSLRKR